MHFHASVPGMWHIAGQISFAEAHSLWHSAQDGKGRPLSVAAAGSSLLLRHFAVKKGKCLNEHAVRPSLSELVEFDEVCLSVLIVI